MVVKSAACGRNVFVGTHNNKCPFIRNIAQTFYKFLDFGPHFSSFSLHFISNERGSIVIRAHASHAEGLRFEPDSMP